MTLQVWVAASALAATIACVPRGPVVDAGTRPEGVGGTIAGTVTASGETPLSGRRVTAVNTATRARFDTSTGTSGAYSVKVPPGTYTLEVELRPGETVATQPDTTDVGVGDIDSARDFVLTR